MIPVIELPSHVGRSRVHANVMDLGQGAVLLTWVGPPVPDVATARIVRFAGHEYRVLTYARVEDRLVVTALERES
jgi:hypothetical protein